MAGGRKRRARSRLFNWGVRAACAIGVAGAGFAITSALIPVLHPGRPTLYPSIVSAVVCQIWAMMLVAQPLLGWWYDEDEPDKLGWLSTKQRIAFIAGGLVAITITAAFIAYVRDANPGP
jgi:hypothetical protein